LFHCPFNIKIDFQGIIIIVEPSFFIWFKNKTGSILGTLPEIPLMWGSQTTFQERNVASVIWDARRRSSFDFVEKNTGIQIYIYKIRNFLFKMDPTFGWQRIQNIRGFCLESRTPFIRLLIFSNFIYIGLNSGIFLYKVVKIKFFSVFREF
jgi:hypothetical protein